MTWFVIVSASDEMDDMACTWIVLVQLDSSNSTLSPVEHGDIALSINTNTKKYYDHVSVYLSVWLLAGLWKYYWFDLAENKSEDRSCSNLDPIRFGE